MVKLVSINLTRSPTADILKSKLIAKVRFKIFLVHYIHGHHRLLYPVYAARAG